MQKLRIITEKKKVLTIAYQEFIKQKEFEGLSERTLDKYTYCWTEFERSITSVFTADISLNSINEYLHYLKENTRTNDVTQRIRVQQIRVAIYWFIEQGYTPYFRIKLPKAVTKVKDIYTTSELEKLLVKPNISKCTFSEYRNWAVVNFLLGTGCRADTLVNIQINDLDLKTAQVRYSHTKNKNQQIVPLTKVLIKVLNEYTLKTGLNSSNENYLFPNSFGAKMTPGSLSHRMREYNRKRGVMRTGTHLFRHTFASLWIKTGGDPFRLQRILGHSTLKMVQNYVRLYTDDIADSYELSNPLEQLSGNKNYINVRGKK